MAVDDRWPGDARDKGINSNDIYLVNPEYSGFSMTVTCRRCSNCHRGFWLVVNCVLRTKPQIEFELKFRHFLKNMLENIDCHEWPRLVVSQYINPSESGRTGSVSRVLKPCHQWPQFWLCKINGSSLFMRRRYKCATAVLKTKTNLSCSLNTDQFVRQVHSHPPN